MIRRSPIDINLYSFLFFKWFYFLFLERGKGKEKEREKNINVWLPLACPLLGTWLATQACALTGNWTSDPLVLRPVLNPLSYTSQDSFLFLVNLAISNLNRTLTGIFMIHKLPVMRTNKPVSFTSMVILVYVYCPLLYIVFLYNFLSAIFFLEHWNYYNVFNPIPLPTLFIKSF